MGTLQIANQTLDRPQRDRCYGCFRPKEGCFCASIPTIENKTEVLIVQHSRERFHPFNTARIVHKALKNSRLLVDYNKNLAAQVALGQCAGLLYPGPGSTLISEVPEDQRPEQLVVLDGTWSNTKTLMRAIPALHTLPRYQLAPASPSRYRIRREPGDLFISTVEATVEALRILEPETRGFAQLLKAFDCMVEGQLAHPKSENGWRQNERRLRTIRNIPLALLGDLRNVVVAYGECAAGERGARRTPRIPIVWVAQRIGTGERFSCAIQPNFLLQESFLQHLELTEQDFSQALTLDEARSAWADFQRPEDNTAVFNQSTAQLFAHLSDNAERCLVLKSVDFNPQRRYATLEELIAYERLTVAPPRHPGRAGKRLANALALVQHLHALGKERG